MSGYTIFSFDLHIEEKQQLLVYEQSEKEIKYSRYYYRFLICSISFFSIDIYFVLIVRKIINPERSEYMFFGRPLQSLSKASSRTSYVR